VPKKRLARKLVKDFGKRGVHPAAFTGSQNDDIKHGVGATAQLRGDAQLLQPIQLQPVNIQIQTVVH
jgi:hypothetical protein